MDSQTYIKNLRVSPKKLRFLLAEIKRLGPVDAIDYLLYTPKKPARIFLKVIKSALNNAKNKLKLEEKNFKFKLLTVEEGQKLKRSRPGGRGTAKPILRRFSHIKIILESKAETKIESGKNVKPVLKINTGKIRQAKLETNPN